MKTIITLLITTVFATCLSARTRKDSLIVIVGEKIELKYEPEENKSTARGIAGDKDTTHIAGVAFSMDHRYIARYKILDLIQGSYTGDTLEFLAYDRYGEPAFSKHRTVLLFISSHKGHWVHEKDQYFELYRTSDGKWASPYSGLDYTHHLHDGQSMKPEKITFKDDISFPVKALKAKQRKRLYPKPYFRIKDGYAVPVYGNYAKDLARLMQQTLLKREEFMNMPQE